LLYQNRPIDPLLIEPEWDAGKLGSLPQYKYYEVHEKIPEDFAGGKNIYYKVREGTSYLT
jgi:hypothetical protein